MKFTLLAALAVLVANASALVSPAPRGGLTEVSLDANVPITERRSASHDMRRSRIAPGDSNAERMARGLAPKAPSGIYHRSPSKTAGAKRQQPSSTGGSGPNGFILAYNTEDKLAGIFSVASDHYHVALNPTNGINFDAPTSNAAIEQTLSFVQSGATYYLASKLVPAVGGNDVVVLQYAADSDDGNPANFCYGQGEGYETSNWGWGQGLKNTVLSYVFYETNNQGDRLNIYNGNDGFVYAAFKASQVPNQNPPLTEDALLTLAFYD